MRRTRSRSPRRRRRTTTASPRTVEKKFADADTLGQVLAREGFGAAGPQVIAALAKLVDPAHDPRRPEVPRSRRDDRARPSRSSTSPRRSCATSSSATARRAPAVDGAQAEQPTSRSRPSRRAASSSRRSTSPCRRPASRPSLVEPAGRALRLGHQLLHRHAPRRSLEGRSSRSSTWAGQFYKYGRVLAAEYGGKVGTFRAFYWAGKGAPRDRPGKYYDEQGAGDLQDDAEDAAALRAHQLEVRPQAPPPDPARREGPPGDRLRRARRARRSGRRPSGRVVEAGHEARLGQHRRDRPRERPSTRATTTCRSSRAGCTRGSR